MYSVQIAVSDGTLTRIALSIEYFEKDDITLYRNLELTPLVLGTDWQWDGDTHINLLTNIPVPLGSYITVRRNTNIDRAFNIYDGGAAFSRETLDENFKQMIYLAQEFTEGNGLTGLYFPLDMHGFQIKNLGNPTDPKDAVTKQYVDTANAAQDTAFTNGQAAQDAAVAASQAVQDNRLASLEGTFVQVTSSYPWFTTTTTEIDTLLPGLIFNKAALYLNGTRQTPNKNYMVVDNHIMLATTIPIGTEVLAILGEDVDNPDGFATTAQLVALKANLQTDIDGKANKGANSDITSITGLTTPLSLGQGGLGATTAAGGRTALGATTVGNAVFTAATAASARTPLGAAASGINADITALTTLSEGITGLVTGGVAVAGVVGEVLGNTAAASATTLTTGVTANTHSIVLTPGEWYVEGAVQLAITAAITSSARSWGISTVSATLSTNWWDNETTLIPTTALGVGTAAHAAPGRIIRVSTSTTVYLVANVTFTAGTTTARGYLRARRIR